MLYAEKVNHVQATFRVNMRVLQMLGLIMVALAVPLVLVALGIRQYSSKVVSSPAPEAPGLRASLEQAAEKNLHPPETISETSGVYLFAPTVGDKFSCKQIISETARNLKGSVIEMPPDTKEEERMWVQVPESQAANFEAQALHGFIQKAKGLPVGECRMYEILFPKE